MKNFSQKYIWILILGCMALHLGGQNNIHIKPSISGFNEMEIYGYSSSNDNVGNIQNEWKSNLDANFIFSPKSALHSNLLFNYSNIRERRFFSLRELHFRYRQKKFNLKLGKQIIDWGDLTGWSISDIPNNFRYFDFIDTQFEEQGLWAITANYHFRKIKMNVKVVPYFKPSQLYIFQNRWIELPKQYLIPEVSEIPFHLELDNVNEIRNHKGPQLGFTLSTTVRNTGVDLKYFYGYNDIPLKTLDITAEPRADTLLYDLVFVYHRLQNLSLQLTSYLDSWNIWGEMAYTRSNYMDQGGSLQPLPYYTFSIGGDRVFSFEDPEKEIKLLIQYIFSSNTKGIEYSADDLDHIFNNAFLTSIDFQLNYDFSLNLKAAFEMKKMGIYLHPGAVYRLNDNFKLAAGFEVLAGSEEGFFGKYKDNSRIRIALKHYFQ